MTQAQGGGLAMAVASAALLGLLIWRIRSGTSYDTRNPAKVTRAVDPFSFWLSLLPLAAVAILCGFGAIKLLL